MTDLARPNHPQVDPPTPYYLAQLILKEVWDFNGIALRYLQAHILCDLSVEGFASLGLRTFL